MPLAINIEELSKRYRLGQVGAGTLSHDLSRTWAKLRGKEDPTIQVTQLNDRTEKNLTASETVAPDYVWALKDINLEVEQGEILGIIGRNGAGKSTLLKLLSRVTAPTTGSIKTRGRIASLLEVGTGFHHELTGRENVYLNGAILGMRRHEVKKQLDAIIDFSGCAKYIDTPVKRYSSGMMVRLGFAVAAHLQCEILIVDEVLAVGDSEFQKRCIGKLKDVSSGEGRTVLFVSHNMQSITSLTKRSVILSKGAVEYTGETLNAISHYLASYEKNSGPYISPPTSNPASVVEVHIKTSEPSFVHTFGKPLEFVFQIECTEPVPGASLSFQIVDDRLRPIVHLWKFDSDTAFCRTPGQYTWKCRIESPKLYMGNYSITVHFGERSGGDKYQTIEGICPFRLEMHGKTNDFGWTKEACTYIEDGNWTLAVSQSRLDESVQPHRSGEVTTLREYV